MVNYHILRNKIIQAYLILSIYCAFVLELNAQLILYVPNPPTFEMIIRPLEKFYNSYVIVQISNKDKKNKDLLHKISLKQSEGRFNSILYNLNLNVIPYNSIIESKYYLAKINSLYQTQIKENCRNYFPTSIGKKQYSLILSDERENLEYEYYPRYQIWEEFDIPSTKSLLIEIDLDKLEHKTSIIDTPFDVFADMCK